MAASDGAPLLTDDNAAFVQGSVSIIAASCNAQRVPSIGRVCGCRVSADRRRVSICIAASQAPELLADIRTGGRIAVAFSRPSTHRTLQLKAEDAKVRPAAIEESTIVASYVEAFAAEIIPLGHTEAQARTMFAHVEGDLVAIDFTPSAAFEQTPGPSAGTPLAPPR